MPDGDRPPQLTSPAGQSACARNRFLRSRVSGGSHSSSSLGWIELRLGALVARAQSWSRYAIQAGSARRRASPPSHQARRRATRSAKGFEPRGTRFSRTAFRSPREAAEDAQVISLKSAALAAVVALGLGGAALAQGMPAPMPPGSTMQNGAPLSNGQTIEPGRRMNQFGSTGMRRRPMMRSRAAMRHRAHMRSRAGMHHRARMHQRMRRPM
jgi:hypothetical protein